MSSARPTFEEALTQLNVELIKMGATVEKSIMDAVEAFKNHDEKLAKDIVAKDRIVDDMEKNIEAQCLSLILRQQPVAGDLRVVSTALKMVTDMERIGDHAENIIEMTQQMIADDLELSKKGIDDLKKMAEESLKSVRNCIIALSDNDIDFAEKVIKEEERVDNLEKQIRGEHMQRLTSGECNPRVGVIFLDALTNLERVSDHALNIAQGVIGANTTKN